MNIYICFSFCSNYKHESNVFFCSENTRIGGFNSVRKRRKRLRRTREDIFRKRERKFVGNRESKSKQILDCYCIYFQLL